MKYCNICFKSNTDIINIKTSVAFLLVLGYPESVLNAVFTCMLFATHEFCACLLSGIFHFSVKMLPARRTTRPVTLGENARKAKATATLVSRSIRTRVFSHFFIFLIIVGFFLS